MVGAQMKIRPNYARRLPKFPGAGATLIYCRVTVLMPEAVVRDPLFVLLFWDRGGLARLLRPITKQRYRDGPLLKPAHPKKGEDNAAWTQRAAIDRAPMLVIVISL